MNISIIGAGGHSKVIIDIIRELGNYNIVGIYDDNKTGYFSGIKIIGKIADIVDNKKSEYFIIGIGNDKIRKKIAEEYHQLKWATLIHPKTIISKTAIIKEGSVVCAGAIIQTEVEVGKQCIINTNCSIDHESIISDYCSICPSSTICGQVKVGESSFIGANSTVIQTINIGNYCIIGAGSVVIHNIPNNSKVVGNPARII
jgi:sugar O-acyltransferase (sialic acid O-acetyltransferase NeuD family)